ncbi:hypothetical protein VC83_02022 [Pseudogymnoascus destructans]|uniref:Myb-like domain-containing protein n=2 Tax=Pseudogymnoascus destructans TaxID=655981 RepID=L8FT25_PSED2|nr:uncharacterized protein VC83_02022 [Pseudogymnoascus destructans]ELR04105.1 hypothetical protein GMDG_01409 [Pseudogymnoascus destructans 20631-21]OAF61336.1 hypothetical protein VC83_02022 [Pseudogymnoascus destructans]
MDFEDSDIGGHGHDVEPIDNDDSGSSYRASSENADESHKVGRKSGGPRRHMKTAVTAKRGDSEKSISAPAISPSEYTEGPTAPEGNDHGEERSITASPRKRRASSTNYESESNRQSRYFRNKKIKGYYNDGYRQLLNNDIKDAASCSLPSDYPPLPNSQIGSSMWTTAEKGSLLTALGRLGKDNIAGIATRIGSKSKLQVQEYLDLLQRNRGTKKPLVLTDLPVAFEVSQKCSQALNEAAEALAMRQERHEETLERAKWGDDSWLLTKGVNESVESHLSEPNGEQALAEVLPAAQLLNLGNWLELSTRVFMNPAGRKDENWRYLIEEGDEHGIRATAFSDFQNLAISVTKRLISATLLCAMSRMRAKDMDTQTKHRQEDVIGADVEAAAQMIGFSINSHNFWKRCPRRNNLQVFQRLTLSHGNRPPMEYDAVEDELNKQTPKQRARSRSRFRSRSRSNSASASGSRASSVSTINASDIDISSDEEQEYLSIAPSEASHGDSAMETDYDSEAQPQQGHGDNPPLSPRPAAQELMDHHATTISPESQELAYADKFDMVASMDEEARLWALLNQNPPILVKDEVDILTKPKIKTRAKDDMVDWRENVEFWSPWETHESLPTEDKFVANQRNARKRRKIVREESESDGGDAAAVETEA